MSPPKHIVFDVVGTLVSFSAFYSAIATHLSVPLSSHTTGTSTTITPQAFGYAWQTAAELDFTFLSVSGRPTAYRDVLAAVFYRTLLLTGAVADLSALTADARTQLDAARDRCVEAYSTQLELRDEAKTAIEMLRKVGWTVWALSTATPARVRAYFDKAGVDFPEENIVSPSSSSPSSTSSAVPVVKPAMEAYSTVLSKLDPNSERWFAAAHMWDVSAAKKAGFKGAYCDVLEGGERCAALFGDMDVVAGGLVEMVEGVIERVRV